ncbi:MAG: CDF family Co(II)/Ni(II) efflux transporter DmeF [Gammaproteobacteria bacterium]|nr:CDF family Co(II)/Ni(II) efflux transporter DmeF [Gammaproteobacteria bacterium]
MHAHDLSPWSHSHVFDTGNPAAEWGTRAVLWITATMMVVEIWAGWWFNSMALLADGWHMSSHALAIGLSAFAYVAARRYARDSRFAFGTWKIEVLAGYTSAVFLLGIAALMAFASIERLLVPQTIQFPEAIAIAMVGLVVNVVCALILGRAEHDHGHASKHGHKHYHHREYHHDLNLRSAYLHVIADAVTSVLAIVALVGGMAFGWNWLDPVMGIVGAVLVARWAWGLLQDTGRVLLDREMDHPVAEEIRHNVTNVDPTQSTQIADLHLWRVGNSKYACILSLVTHDARLTPARVKACLCEHDELTHVTVEIHQCE